MPSVLNREELVFEVIVTDSNLSSTAGTVRIEAVRRVGAPEFLSVPSLFASVGDAYVYDADSTVEVAGVLDGLHFTRTLGPAEFSVGETTGQVQWTPVAPGAIDIAINVTTSAGQATQSFTVNAVRRPEILSQPNTIFLLGVPYAYDNNDGLPEAVGTSPLAWSLEPINPANKLPTGMTVDTTTGRIQWIAQVAEPVAVNLVVRNAYGEARQQLNLARPIDKAPSLARGANLQGRVGNPYLFDSDGSVSTNDLATGEKVLIVSLQKPAELVVHPTTGEIGWVPTAADKCDVSSGAVGRRLRDISRPLRLHYCSRARGRRSGPCERQLYGRAWPWLSAVLSRIRRFGESWYRGDDDYAVSDSAWYRPGIAQPRASDFISLRAARRFSLGARNLGCHGSHRPREAARGRDRWRQNAAADAFACRCARRPSATRGRVHQRM